MPRRKHDFYETPPHYLDALVAYVEIPEHSMVLDACVGERAIIDRLKREYNVAPITNDIDTKRKASYHCDATTSALYDKFRSRDLAEMWWITNPPFDVIDDVLTQAISNCGNVITLARLSVLEPTKNRRAIYGSYQPDMVIVLPRYCFRLNDKGKRATDSVTCAWIGWGPQVPHLTTVWTQPPPEEK